MAAAENGSHLLLFQPTNKKPHKRETNCNRIAVLTVLYLPVIKIPHFNKYRAQRSDQRIQNMNCLYFITYTHSITQFDIIQ